ncbi:GntR family transcriptional regulator [Planomicrobium sp. CPCC 101079]|uniref:GntR family transcriptional regulator n=1 Tax=Planomicrobium sp. CPCC 101079 TaxID=2599618 RepID=UPI0011B64345|nr:GntR family transcriptional regulator [Planomicrobium sp. CPCC 101079]TWT01797.1 GntR family transcriptional regulator [Planomicrobium sp. CPCC 101079]
MVNTRTESAYEYIKENILNGTYKPHQRLTENELSEMTGASRNTVKNALIQLQKENLVDIQKNKGAYIRDFSLSEILNYLEIREHLEGLVARSAALHITDEQLGRMEAILAFMKDCIEKDKFDEYSKSNVEFHKVIHEASRKPQAVEIISTIRNQIARYHFRSILIPGRKKFSFEEHKAIFEALQARDPDEAESTSRIHVAHVYENVQKHSSFL